MYLYVEIPLVMLVLMNNADETDWSSVVMMRVDRKTTIAFLLVLLFIKARGRILVNFIKIEKTVSIIRSWSLLLENSDRSRNMQVSGPK